MKRKHYRLAPAIRIGMIVLFVVIILLFAVSLIVDFVDGIEKVSWGKVFLKAGLVLLVGYVLYRWPRYGFTLDDQNLTIHGYLWTTRVSLAHIAKITEEERIQNNKVYWATVLRDESGKRLAEFADFYKIVRGYDDMLEQLKKGCK